VRESVFDRVDGEGGGVESAELTVGVYEGDDVEVVAVEVEGGVVVGSVGGG
jgi:hypothetical protein